MGSSLPSLTRYLDSLPDGLNSHPEVCIKASLLRSTLDHDPLPPHVVAALPDALRPVVETPPPVSSWVPEVHNVAILCAVYDAMGGDDEAFDLACLERQKKLFAGPLYKIVFAISSPASLIRSVANRWKSLRKGTLPVIEESSPTGATFFLELPDGLWNATPMHTAFRVGLGVVLSLSRARDVDLRITDHSRTHLRLRGTWTLG